MSNKKKNTPKFTFNAYWIYIPLILFIVGMQFFNSENLVSSKITKNEFTEILVANDIEKIVVENNSVAKIFLKEEALKKEEHQKLVKSPFYNQNSSLYTYNFGNLENFEKFIQKEKGSKGLDFDTVNEEHTSLFDTVLSFLPFILLIAVWLFFMRRMSGGAGGAGGGGQIFNIGKSKAKLFDENTKVKTTFKNVAGLEGAKEEIQEIVEFLKNPQKYTKLGGKIPKGALLVGPPGTGKTLLAKAVAGEAGVPFFSLSGSDFVEMFVGVGASRVRDLFKQAIHHQDFLDAVDRIVGGLEKKNKVITPKEKKVIAYHEAGHATVSWMLEYAAPLVKVTIVPRGQSLGAAWYLPEERKIVQTEQMLDEMCATMGGRAAEKLIFDKISTGALSDLEKVTKQARAMVTVYGLNEKVGNVTYYDSSGNDSFVKPYSDDTAKIIDDEISKIIENQYQRAIEILDTHKDKLEELANKLLEKEVIFKDDLVQIFGKRPFEKEEVKQEQSEPEA